MQDIEGIDFAGALDALRESLVEIRTAAAALSESKVEAGEARSISDLRAGADVALDLVAELRVAAVEPETAGFAAQAAELRDYIVREVAAPALVDDIAAAADEAEAELAGKVGMHRTPYKSFVEIGRRLVETVRATAEQAGRLVQQAGAGAPRPPRKEIEMAENADRSDLVAELQGIGRQLSFLGAAAQPAAGGAGRFPGVSEQLMATLDALGLPHHGVQFAMPSARDQARGDLIEGLFDAFREEVRDGNPVYVPGPTEGRRRPMTAPSRIQAGAARVAARLVRAEADNILDILDRLPDLTRFRTRPGVPSAAEARQAAAERFADLDEVMADPMGVNLPRADFALKRIVRALFDFFDYANLERELVEELRKLGTGGPIWRMVPRPPRDDDEVGQRRPVVLSEEIRREIAEVTASFARLVARVHSPLSDSLGTAASRLEQTLTVVHGSALSLRELLVRSGSSLPEQDVHLFSSGLAIEVQDRWRPAPGKGKGGATTLLLSTGQVLDWILEVAEPHVGADHRAAALEREDFAILAGELDAQADALGRVQDECRRLGFAYRLPGPMRQLEELTFHIKTAAKLAAQLTAPAAGATGTGG